MEFSRITVWFSEKPKHISMGECNTILSAHTLYRHLE